MATRFQHGAMCQNRTVHPNDVVALAHHHAPPVLLEIIFQLDPKRTVIPATVHSAVDFARLENESAPLAQADDFLHPLRISLVAHDHRRATANYADDTDEEGESSKLKNSRVVRVIRG